MPDTSSKSRLPAPDRAAVVFAERTWTFRELDDATARAAAILREHGIRAGDRVGILASNIPAWLWYFRAILRAGAVAVPLSPAYTASELQSILACADLRVLLLEEAFTNVLKPASRKAFEVPVWVLEGPFSTELQSPVSAISTSTSGHDASREAAVIFFSSGSTGIPKGIVHSQRNLNLMTEATQKNWAITQHDSLLVAMPLAFMYASVVGCLTAISAGATIVLQNRFRAEEVLSLMVAGRITAIMGVPTMYRLLLDAAPARNSIPKLRFCASAGDSLPRDVLTKFESVFGCPMFEFYGLTEAPHVFAHAVGVDGRSRPYSCGRPLLNVRVRIVDETGRDMPVGEIGEAIVQTPWMFLEYFRNPDATASSLRDGWFSTGDYFRSDEDGYLYVMGRKKELIKRGGLNVLPAEIEHVISVIPGIADVAVIGVRDDTLGERVRAYVVKSTDSDLTEEAILHECTKHLAKYKIPEEIKFVLALPKGPTGKVSRQTLRSQAHS